MSPNRQRSEIERTAKAKGFTVVEWFEDPDISAYKKVSRPGFEEMLSRLDEVGAIFAWEMSRWARRLVVSAGMFDLLEEKGVRWISTTQGDSAEIGRDYFEMIAVHDARESRKIAERVSLAHRYKALTLGRQISPKRSFGFRYDAATKQLTIDEAEAVVVRKMAAAYIAGMGSTMIARGLNDGSFMGAPVKPLRAEEWVDGTVRQLLSSPTIAGWVVYKGQPVGEEPTEPALIDLDTWRLLTAVRAERTRRRRRPGRPSRALLTGLLRCAGCGGRAFSNGGRYPVYFCGRAPHGGLCNAPASMSSTRLEAIVIEQFWNHVDREKVDAERRSLSGEDPNSELLRERTRLEGALERLLGLFAETGSVGEETVRRKLAEYEDRIAVVDEKLAASVTKGIRRGAMIGLEDLWPHFELTEKREALAAYIERITIRRHPRGVSAEGLSEFVQVKWR